MREGEGEEDRQFYRDFNSNGDTRPRNERHSSCSATKASRDASCFSLGDNWPVDAANCWNFEVANNT